MTVADVELTIQGHESVAARSPRPAGRHRSVVILGQATETNCALAAALAEQGQPARLAQAATSPRLVRGDLALARLDVLPTLDGIEPGLWRLPWLERQGVQLLNSPLALFAAHDKLSTALLLGRARVAHPQTAHVREVSVPTFPPPYVVKPRFGSWGRDVYRCRDEDELRARLERLRHRRWFRRHGALVQSLVEPTGRDLRLVVAGGRVVGAVERRALPGEWRTNVALGALRTRVSAPPAARALALRAVARSGSTSPASTSPATRPVAATSSRSTARLTSTRSTPTTSSRPRPRRCSSEPRTVVAPNHGWPPPRRPGRRFAYERAKRRPERFPTRLRLGHPWLQFSGASPARAQGKPRCR
jgi:RimK family alpha-L-glutamate ligase